MRVLVIFSSSDIGGAEKSLTRILSQGQTRKISYEFSTFGFDGDWGEFARTKKLKPVFFNNSLIKLIRYLRNSRPDAVYIIGFKLSIFLRLTKLIFPGVFLVQGVRWNPSSKSLLDQFFRFLESFLSNFLDGYIVNSDISKSTLKSIIKNNNIKLIYNGINKKEIGEYQKSNKQYITSVANISERKGFIDYLDIIKLVIIDRPNAIFLFIGKDKLNGELQRFIQLNKLDKNIIFLGYKKDIFKYLNESIMFVLPSQYGEGCPTAILEAFLMSLPVVAYKIDGIPEIVRNNIDGFLCNVGDKISMSQNIISLIDNPELRDKMGKQGKNRIINNFTIDHAYQEHNSFFMELK